MLLAADHVLRTSGSRSLESSEAAWISLEVSSRFLVEAR